MFALYKMPTFERAAYVAEILRGIRIDAWEEWRTGQPYLVVASEQRGIDAAVQRLEPRAQRNR